MVSLYSLCSLCSWWLLIRLAYWTDHFSQSLGHSAGPDHVVQAVPALPKRIVQPADKCLASIQCRNIYHKMGVHIEKELLLHNRWILETGSVWPPFHNWPAITRAGNCHAIVCSTDNSTPTEKTIGTPVHTDTFRRTIIMNIINHPPCSEWAVLGQNFQTWC